MKRTIAVIVVLLFIAAAASAIAEVKKGKEAAKPAMPGVLVFDKLSKIYGPVKFDHPKHVMMSNGCGDCHHEHNTSTTSSCKGCHALGKEQFKGSVHSVFLGCSACHGKQDPANPKVVSLQVAYHTQCFGCHKDLAGVGKSPKACTEQCHAKL